MDVEETIKIISKQWCTVNDIIKLTGLSKSQSYAVKHEIERQVEKKGKKLIRGLVPMKFVVDYFEIDLDYLERVSNMYKNIKED